MSFPRYPKYRDSGAEWLGAVPEKWEVRRLKFCCRLLLDKTERREFPVALENIESWTGRLLPSETEFQGDGISFDVGDILFGKLRPYLAKVHLASFPGEAVGDFHVLRPAPEINGRFLQYLMLSREFIDTVNGATFGSKMPRASWEFVGGMRVAVPSLPEQGLIAEFLDRETAKVDVLVAEQRRLLELLKEKRQAVISQAVTKGINTRAPMKPSGVDLVGEIPAHWKYATLSRMASRVVVGIAEAAVHAYAARGIPILRSTNIRAGKLIGDIWFIDSAFSDARAGKTIRAGDLVTVRTGNAGVTAVIPKELDGCQCFTMLITTMRTGMLPEYYCYWMNSVQAQYYFSLEGWGTAQVNISVPILKALPIPIPPTAEQNEIVSFLNREAESLESLIAEASRAIDLLNERRAALISAVVTGQVDVRGVAEKVPA